ncbi:MAG: TauD/TfdA family dioxygenase [Thalassobaculum sp.]|uniref:TauD/TfdA family dioxygenase n=1 Tax=Thalassobaculum sp. TaxID=2022740 RepID=UPI0032F01975
MAQFAIGMGGTSFDQGYSVAVDSSGNSYVTGYFDGTVDFDPGAGTTNLTGAGSVDVYIVKYDSSGALVWAKNVGGTNTDQSYRRPPPAISLFYAEPPLPKGQGQTLYADGIGAYAALPDAMKARIAGLDAIHVSPGRGRSEQAALAGGPAPALDPRDTPQRQPIVRIHPVTGEPALYLREISLRGRPARLLRRPDLRDGEGPARRRCEAGVRGAIYAGERKR